MYCTRPRQEITVDFLGSQCHLRHHSHQNHRMLPESLLWCGHTFQSAQTIKLGMFSFALRKLKTMLDVLTIWVLVLYRQSRPMICWWIRDALLVMLPVPLSVGGIGGCSQDQSYTPSPTAAPTPFTCSEKVFEVELLTDEFAEETSWQLTDSNNKVIASGSGYRNERINRKTLCLPADEYKFSILDSEGDGICCEFGTGQYSIYYDGKLLKTGGDFKKHDVITFGEPTPGACRDDNKWVFTTNTGKEKKCKYLQALPSKRCALEGIDKTGKPANGHKACPRSCSSCAKSRHSTPKKIQKYTPTPRPTELHTRFPTSPPTLQPSPSPTTGPSPLPTSRPTIAPSEIPTHYPTVSPTALPTLRPTESSTKFPTSKPTLHPSPSPTATPTPFPTSQPKIAPTKLPTHFSSANTTVTPTPKPSELLKSPSSDQNTCLSDKKGDGDYSYPCGFPFKYKGKEYYACTGVGLKGTPWCYHKDNILLWGRCMTTSACFTGR